MKDRFKYFSKDKQQRIQQLSLIIHNCRVYGVEVRKEYLDELNELTKD